MSSPGLEGTVLKRPLRRGGEGKGGEERGAERRGGERMSSPGLEG